jgi:hypothetical protein
VIELVSAARGAYGCGLQRGARAAARDAGAELRVHDDSTAAAQGATLSRLLGGAVHDRPRAVVLDPLDHAALGPLIRAAHDQGVAVIVVDEPPEVNPGLAWGFVGTDRSAQAVRGVPGQAVGRAAVQAALAGLAHRQVAPRRLPPASGRACPG